VAAVFLVEMIVIIVLAERPGSKVVAPESRTALALASADWSSRWLAESSDANDPTLLALPGSYGFSGGAWLNFTQLEPRLTDWSEPVRWLEMDQQRLAHTFLSFISTNTRLPLLVADLPNARAAASEPNLPEEIFRTNSTVRMEGEIAARPLLNKWTLPSRPHSDLLSNSVVQVMVDLAGHVVTTTLLAGCGDDEADRLALKLANTARFTPALKPVATRPPDDNLSWGRIVFQWHTVPSLPPTNTSVVAP
jgi:hypothetical protein